MSKFRTFMQVVGVVGTVVGVGATIVYAYWEGKKDGADETVENLKEALEKHNEDDTSGNEIVDVDLVGYEAEIAAGKVTSVSPSEALKNGTWLGEETKEMLFGTMFDVVAMGLSWMASDRVAEKATKNLRVAKQQAVVSENKASAAFGVINKLRDSYIECNNTLFDDVCDAARDGKADIYKTLKFAFNRYEPCTNTFEKFDLVNCDYTISDVLQKEGIVIE